VTSHAVQDEILVLMALYIERRNAQKVASRVFGIMADETPDISNVEQIAVCVCAQQTVRWKLKGLSLAYTKWTGVTLQL